MASSDEETIDDPSDRREGNESPTQGKRTRWSCISEIVRLEPISISSEKDQNCHLRSSNASTPRRSDN
jgi:hypothetical protein